MKIVCEKLRDFGSTIEKLEKEKGGVTDAKSKEKLNEVKVLKDTRSPSGKHKVVWIGTSVSKALDSKKFEKDLNVDLKMVKAYCVDKEGRFPQSCFKSIVPDAVKGADTVVLQTGSIEITNIDVNKATMDSTKELDVYKKEWFDKVDKASSSLFKIAEECVAADQSLNVIIVKRPPRFDRGSKDILGIKQKLSEYGNQAYDQLLTKSNYSDKIHLVELNLVQNSNYLRTIIYGSHDDPRFDGVHMITSESSRHFTYRAVQAIHPILQKMKVSRQPPSFARKKRNEPSVSGGGTNGHHFDRMDYKENHNYNINQSASSQQGERSDKLYADVVSDGHQGYNCPLPQSTDYLGDRDIRNQNRYKSGYRYSVPTSNQFENLNQENC